MKNQLLTFVKQHLFLLFLLAVSPMIFGHSSCKDHSHKGKCIGDTVPCANVHASTKDCPSPCVLESQPIERGGGFTCVGVGLSCNTIGPSDKCMEVGCNWVECTQDSECSGGKKCIRNICGACKSDSDCLSGQRCRNEDKMCVTANGPDGALCDRDGQCLNACINGTCQSRRPAGQTCGNNADCQSRLCNDGKCGCNDNNQCEAGQRCRSDNVCVTANGPDGALCDQDGQCLNACINGVCAARRAAGQLCGNNADCQSRLCNGGRCGCDGDDDCGIRQRCRSDNVCVTANGETDDPCDRDGQCLNACIDRKCQPRRPAGQPCGNNADCQSRQCNGNVCG